MPRKKGSKNKKGAVDSSERTRCRKCRRRRYKEMMNAELKEWWNEDAGYNYTCKYEWECDRARFGF